VMRIYCKNLVGRIYETVAMVTLINGLAELNVADDTSE